MKYAIIFILMLKCNAGISQTLEQIVDKNINVFMDISPYYNQKNSRTAKAAFFGEQSYFKIADALFQKGKTVNYRYQDLGAISYSDFTAYIDPTNLTLNISSTWHCNGDFNVSTPSLSLTMLESVKEDENNKIILYFTTGFHDSLILPFDGLHNKFEKFERTFEAQFPSLYEQVTFYSLMTRYTTAQHLVNLRFMEAYKKILKISSYKKE